MDQPFFDPAIINQRRIQRNKSGWNDSKKRVQLTESHSIEEFTVKKA